MAVLPITKESGKIDSLLATNSTTFTKGQMIKFSSGRAVTAAQGDNFVDYVSLEGTTTTTDDYLMCLKVDPSIKFHVDVDAAISQANVGFKYDVKNGTHVDTGNQTDKVFLLTEIDPSCNTKAYGYFQQAIA